MQKKISLGINQVKDIWGGSALHHHCVAIVPRRTLFASGIGKPEVQLTFLIQRPSTWKKTRAFWSKPRQDFSAHF